MNKEEYQLRKSEIEKQISDLRQKISDLDQQYINSQIQFIKGERIKILTPERKKDYSGVIPEKTRFAYFERYEIDYRNELELIVFKEKKDGTPSKNKDYINRNEIVLKIN